MSDKEKNEEKNEVAVENVLELKTGIDKDSNVDSDVKEDESNDGLEDSYGALFISENDLFDVEVKYNVVDKTILVKGIDEKYSDKDSEQIVFTFKYPNHGDCNLISSLARTRGVNGNPSEATVRDYRELESIRMAVLIRKWSLKKDLTDINISNLNPKIILSLLDGVRNKIGIMGIL